MKGRRTRRYVPGAVLLLARPMLRFSTTRDAYVLRAIGNSRGPVLRRERRAGSRKFEGQERRGQALAG